MLGRLRESDLRQGGGQCVEFGLDTSGVNAWFQKLNRIRGPGERHLHPHLFRHSIAVHLLRCGADIRYIQQFLGHGDLNTTKVYLRLVPGHLKDD